VNANQVFKWRRAWERGELTDGYAALLPVSVSSPLEPEIETSKTAEQELVSDGGSIHVELSGRALISIERGADPKMVRCIIESICK
jgi:transposase-like protein